MQTQSFVTSTIVTTGSEGMPHMDVSSQMERLASGHWMLVACAVLYLIWWWVFFRPRDGRPQGLEYALGVACILGAAACGIIAVIRISGALSEMPNAFADFHLWIIAVVAYVVLLVVTYKLFDRPVTTELLLIVGWAALEVNVIGALAATEPSAPLAPLAAAIAAGFVISLVCYTLYYRLEGMPSFVDGCVPLAIVGVIAAVFALALG
jgi:hypothetical protein